MNVLDKNYLIAGGSGFIGYHFHQFLPTQNLVNLDLRKPNFDHQSATFIKGDIRKAEDVEKALKAKKCDAIIILAAEHQDFGLTREDYFRTNEYGTKIICEVASKFNLEHIIFFSSVAVYGNNQVPSHENLEPNPNGWYGESKLAAEQIIKSWVIEDTSRSALILRPTVVYGEENYANMYRLIGQIKKKRYFNVGRKNNIKSIAYVKNLIEATLFLMESLEEPGLQIFNYSDDEQLKSKQIGKLITIL